jgi:hypothetical protein
MQKLYCESISVPDVLSIRNVSEIHANIIDAFKSNSSIVIEISESAEADMSFIQLIESARRQAKALNKSIALSSPAQGRVLKVLERAGFIEAFDRDDANFWLHKEVKQ